MGENKQKPRQGRLSGVNMSKELEEELLQARRVASEAAWKVCAIKDKLRLQTRPWQKLNDDEIMKCIEKATHMGVIDPLHLANILNVRLRERNS